MSAAVIWGVIPVKRFALAKSRLAPILDGPARSTLARAMFAHVLQAAVASGALDGLLIVTDDPEAQAMALAAGAVPRQERAAAPFGEVIDDALAHAHGALRADAAVVLMADLPSLVPGEIAAFVAQLRRGDADLIVAPDRREAGVNALALRLPTTLATCFGHPDSFARHRAAATRLGLRLEVHPSPGLGFDVDEPADLEVGIEILPRS